ncbi:MAG TPA: hypothetical protein VMB71_08540 [Acetobacteraceae bacterium]|nr:hypothetical protein [Acetobacteraceae bacterium]
MMTDPGEVTQPLPKSLRRDLALLLAAKLAALAAIYFLFFSPAHRNFPDIATHIAGDPAAPQE